MAFEIERKYIGARLEDVASRLQALGAVSQGFHFESNIIFDRPDLSLVHAGRLLRLRLMESGAERRCILTLKGRTIAGSRADVKIRPEWESEAADFQAMKAILLGLGYEPAATYEKGRESWLLELPGSGLLKVDLDTLPFCRVVEIEGPERALDEAGRLIGLDNLEKSPKSYHELHQDWLRENGLEPRTGFAFEGSERERIRHLAGLAG